MVLVLENNLRVTLETPLRFLSSAGCVGLMAALIWCTETQIKLVGLWGGLPSPWHHAATGRPQQLLKLGWCQGLGGCRGSTVGCSKEGQPHGGCSAHFHVFSTFFPSRLLSALAGSCAGAHLHCPPPMGSPTRGAKGPQFW